MNTAIAVLKRCFQKPREDSSLLCQSDLTDLLVLVFPFLVKLGWGMRMYIVEIIEVLSPRSIMESGDDIDIAKAQDSR